MQALGYNYRYPSKEDYEFAKIEARSMPNWPHPNSVQIRKNLLLWLNLMNKLYDYFKR